MRLAPLLLLALGGCAASATPLVDMTDVNPVTYQRDLDDCESIGTSYDPAGPVLVGALMGASVGFGVGGLAYSSLAGTSVAEGWGGASGAVAGAGLAAGANEGVVPLPKGVPQERVPVSQCLSERGYKVLPRP
ncbi:MAG TPA: hypothetical protein VFA22_09265 [Stellaceae bacterium]|nr:hypothetical protein [Stellaceae bacterium]